MRRYKVCKESRDVVVGDLVFDGSISSRALEVVTVHSKDVVTSLKGKDETFQFCLEKKRYSSSNYERS